MSVSDVDTVTLCAVGDLSLGDSPKMLGIGVRSATCLRGGDFLFANVRDTLQADLVFGNLEGVLSDFGYDARSFHRAQLRGLPTMVEVLKNAGFNILNVANNHMMQYGPQAFQETCEILKQHGIVVVGLKGQGGWNSQPVELAVKGRKIGFLGYGDPDNYGYEPCYALNQQKEILADVARLRNNVDILVVSLHWGDEFVHSPSPACRICGQALVEAGTNIVLGHHPHVVQGIEQYRSGWVCYSLGNFVSDMIWNPRTQEGLATIFDLTSKGTPMISVNHIVIKNDFAPRAVPVNLADIAVHVAEDEADAATEVAYCDLVKSRVKENRKLAHIHLLKNFYRFKLIIYFQIWRNSLCSLNFFRIK